MKYKHKRLLLKLLPFNRIRRKLKNISFSDDEITVYDTLVVLFKKLQDDEILERANGVAFSFTVAIFPAIIFLFSLVPFIHQFIPEIDNESIMEFISQWMPDQMYSVVESTISDIVSKSRGGLLTFGALFALFLASNGTVSLMNAFNSIYKTKENRSFFKTRAIAAGLTILLAIALVAAIVLLIAGQILLDLVNDLVIDTNDLPIPINTVLILRFVVLFAVFLLSISFIYYFAPAVHFKWRFISIGGITATLLSMTLSYLFSFYVTNFASYNRLYGSIGVMLALMIWLYLLSVVILVGYEINSAIHQVRHLEKIESLKEKELQLKLKAKGRFL